MDASATLETLPELVEQVHDAVVHIEVEGQEQSATGSGFAIRPRDDDSAPAVIVTNAHVAAGMDVIRVRFHDAGEYEAEPRLVDDATDLALLTVPIPAQLPLDLRRLNEVRVGEPVLALGSPLRLEGTVTTGIVSGLDRTMPSPSGIPIDNMIQTDAHINPGNSGGPLLGLDSRVIGVNDQTIVGPGSAGLGFAIPAETVALVYEEICETGASQIRRGTLRAPTGLRRFTFDEEKRWGQRAGAMVIRPPEPDSPADRAGLTEGDVILGFDGHTVDEPGDLYRLLDRHRIGRECRIDFLRDGERCDTTAVPAERSGSKEEGK